MSQSWTLAKENDKAIPVMLAAARLSDDGELDAQLGQLYLNMERWDEALAASKRALEKGGLRNEGTSHLVMGMAYFNVGQYNLALNKLADAQEHSTSRGMAQQWAKYVETEKANSERLMAALSSESDKAG